MPRQKRAGKDEPMEPRLNIVTLGVRDLQKAVAFYRDGFGVAAIERERR